MQRAHLRSAGRCAVGEILSVFAGLVPVECDRAVGGEFVGINENTVGAVESFAHIKDWLVLRAFAPRVEVIPARELRRRDAADRKQLGQAFVDSCAPRKRIEQRTGVRHFFGDKLLRLGALAILEPPVVVDDARAVEIVRDGFDLDLGKFNWGGSGRRFLGRLGIACSVDGSDDQKQGRESPEQTQTS